MTTKANLTELKTITQDETETHHTLSPETVQLCLIALVRSRLVYRGAWDDLTDAEWDEADALVSQAQDELIKGVLMTGQITAFAGATAPDGWLICDGQAISRADYSRLFAAIGTTYGVGDGSTTFNLPDLRGRVPAGVDGATFAALGTAGGEETHTLTVGEMPSHTHSDSGAVASVTTVGLEPPEPTALPIVTVTGATGGDGAHNNLQPYLTVNFIIKT